MSVAHLYHPSLYRFDEAQPSYWEETAGDRDLAARPLARDEHCDVAVIGGGFTGLSAALHLARDFAVDVRVLEAGHIGWGASGRNGGFCSIGGTKLSIRRQMRRFGTEQTRRYYQSQVEAIELVRSLGSDEGIDFEACGDGEMTVARNARAFRALEADAEVQRRALGLDVTLLSREAFREQGYDSPEAFGAAKLVPTFGLHPMRFVLGLARAAERRGAVLHPRTRVDAWSKDAGQHVLETPAGALRAKRVIVACNGFMPEHLHGTLLGRPLPYQSNIVVTRPLTEAELDAHRWRNPCPSIEARHLYVYFRMLPDRRLLLGGRGDASGEPGKAVDVYRRLEGRIAAIWPHWRDVAVTHRWRGLVCFTSGLRPSIGKFPDDPSVMFGFGYHGNGVNTATWAGRELAYWLAGANSDDAVEPLHLPALVRGFCPRFPLARLRRLYARLGTLYFRLKDTIG
ncbi:MAG: FAD-dependent oxidoreductase [Gammaproteobacteria bacterium]|nr:FAD-dependent oxidoreductase [Gammaproteobacteria bacterium]NIM73989.1 FAD-dependent oxidoreductase [Gammaproteobacteria bacterium]NIN38870.1 FAD-dependent oxidoreductase [Gammaproteobacteria bacterium]NIO25765.1 FAD-dependent oxidoreductase [Gammaproteobacteria bacterium]NIO66395.1 FAD-dependent oxidoreductase [Gammaproteobacteria bacterium]